MLSWSAATTHRDIDVKGVADPGVDPGPPGGMALTALGRAAIGVDVDASFTLALVDALGAEAAVDAAAVAGAFELYNRVVDAGGLPVGRVTRQTMADVIDALGMAAFPHADW